MIEIHIKTKHQSMIKFLFVLDIIEAKRKKCYLSSNWPVSLGPTPITSQTHTYFRYTHAALALHTAYCHMSLLTTFAPGLLTLILYIALQS